MIDKVKIYTEVELDVTKFDKKFKYVKYVKEPVIDLETGEVIKDGYTFEGYEYRYNSLIIVYSLQSNRLRVEGRLPNLAVTRNLVYNLDDYMLGQEKIIKETEYEHSQEYLCENSWYDVDDTLCFPEATYTEYEIVHEEIPDIISNINDKLYELTKVKFDILDFNVTYAEVTFNIFGVEHVGRYIELFNLIFDKKNDSRYKNFVKEMGLKKDTSFYVKAKSQFDKKTKTAYTINFYNKANQLEALQENPKNKAHITLKDRYLSKNVLRLEVQLGYQELKKTSKEFRDFLDIVFCQSIIVQKYKYFISRNETLDFYSYQAAKKVINETDKLKESDKKTLLKYIQEKHQYNKSFSIQTERKYNRMLESLGIHWCFIPTKWGIDYLESPIKLLNKKVNMIINDFQWWEEYEEWRGYPIDTSDSGIEIDVDELFN